MFQPGQPGIWAFSLRSVFQTGCRAATSKGLPTWAFMRYPKYSQTGATHYHDSFPSVLFLSLLSDHASKWNAEWLKEKAPQQTLSCRRPRKMPAALYILLDIHEMHRTLMMLSEFVLQNLCSSKGTGLLRRAWHFGQRLQAFLFFFFFLTRIAFLRRLQSSERACALISAIGSIFA